MSRSTRVPSAPSAPSAPAALPVPAGPVRPSAAAHTVLRPALAAAVQGGFWYERREVNARVGIPQGPGLLESAGNLHDLRLAAGTADGPYQGAYPFMDSDVYKWLEAASWQLGQVTGGAGEAGEAAEEQRAGGAGGDGGVAGAGGAHGAGAADGVGGEPGAERITGLAAEVDRVIALVAAAQQPDGYLNTWFQAAREGGRYEDLRWGHELYCAGHLIQAGIAHRRATGRRDLLDVAVRFADHIDSVFGPAGSVDGIDGHPEIETALVELYRETGERRYLDLARHFVDRRGYGLLGGEAYCQDRVPVRAAENAEGHAVRQLYLLAAVADLAAETGDARLRAAGERVWGAMVATKTHLTGGLGAHHDEEDFGDPFELPTERAYCETCAAVASVQFSWRMALLTGEARYSDLVERTLFNGFLAGVSLDGERWLYVNPLQVRDGHTDIGGDQSARRTRWFRCACCPPNVMRLLAGLEHYVASTDGAGVQLHQYATGRYTGYAGHVAGAAGGAADAAARADGGDAHPVTVSVHTAYPADGTVTVTVDESPPDVPWTLSLRVPRWCRRFSVLVGGEPVAAPVVDGGWLRLRRMWSPDERVVLELDLEPRLTRADPRVDAVRGCVAVERGPLVHCLEGVDHPGGGLDDVVLDVTRPLVTCERPDLLGGVTTVLAAGHRRDAAGGDWWPYRDVRPPATEDVPGGPAGEPLQLTAIPYYAWANRQDGAMRVWIPTG